MTEAERLEHIDLENGAASDAEVLWALNYLLNLPDDDDTPLFA